MLLRSPLMAPSACVLLVCAAAILRGDPGIASPRPKQAPPLLLPSIGLPEDATFVPCRLWEDPLRRVYERIEGLEAKAKGPDGAEKEITDLVERSKRDRADLKGAFVLAAMVASGINAEEREGRLQIRQAIHSALALEDIPPKDGGCGGPLPAELTARAYAPADGDRMRFFVGAYGGGCAGSRRRALPLPYEVFDATGPAASAGDPPSPRRVIVLWIDEQALDGKPLHALLSILDWLGVERGTATPKGGCAPTPPCAVVGPTDSTLFAQMLEEMKGEKPCCNVAPESLIPIYSPSATLHVDKDSCLCSNAFRIVRTIGDDEELVNRLVEEFDARHIDRCHTALFIETDTTYGRGLFDLIAKQNKAKQGGDDCDVGDRDSKSGPWRLYRYERGLDGLRPTWGSAGAKAGASGQPDAPSATDMPRAEGTSRLDAVARLRQRIATEGGTFQGVGILGTDVYDKMLLLGALRTACPRAVFFTTDLDARLLDPAHWDKTHNLVIVSHYGLELPDDLQRGVLPFRSGYQTATFLSAAVALGKTPYATRFACAPPPAQAPAPAPAPTPAKPAPEPRDDGGAPSSPPIAGPFPPNPHVYEVGRSGAFDLTRRGRVDPFHPMGDRENVPMSAVRLGLLVLGATVLALCAYATVRTLRRETRRTTSGSWIAAGAGVLAVAVLAIGCLDGFYGEYGEPFALAEGISVWPTCVLRVLLLGLAVHYALSMSRGLHEWETGEARRWLPDPVPCGPRRTCWERIREAEPLFWHVEATSNAACVWERCVLRGGARVSLLRVGSLSLVWFGLTVWFFNRFEGPSVPTRGEWAYWVNGLTLYPCLLALIFLNVSVFDAALVQLALMRDLASSSPDWPYWPDGVESDKRSRLGLDDGAAGTARAWLTMEFVGHRTQLVERFVYYPFVALLVMVLIHHPVFDDFSKPTTLLVVYGICFGCTLLGGYLLSNRANALRSRAIEQAGEDIEAARRDSVPVEAHVPELAASVRGDLSAPRLRRAPAAGRSHANGRVAVEPDAQRSRRSDAAKARVDALERVRREMREYEIGSFGGVLASPTLRALLIPGSGVGFVALVEHFLRAS